MHSMAGLLGVSWVLLEVGLRTSLSSLIFRLSRIHLLLLLSDPVISPEVRTTSLLSLCPPEYGAKSDVLQISGNSGRWGMLRSKVACPKEAFYSYPSQRTTPSENRILYLLTTRHNVSWALGYIKKFKLIV